MTATRRGARELAACLLAGGVWGMVAGPGNDWDLRNYHFYGPFAWLSGRLDTDLNAVGLQTTFNPLLDVPFYLLATGPLSRAPHALAFVAGLPWGGLAWLVTVLCRRLLGPRLAGPAGIAALFGLSGSVGLSEIGQSFGDLPLAALLIAALIAALPGPQHVSRGATAGLLAGLAAGLKLTAAAFAPGLGIALLIGCLGARTRLAAAAAFGVAWLAGWMLAGGWWSLHLWQQFANPVFPLLNGLFHSPWALPDAGLDDRFLPHGVAQTLFYPFFWLTGRPFVAAEIGVRDAHFAMAMLALPLLARAGWRGRLDRSHACLLGFVITGYVIWEAAFSILRYAVCLELLTGLMVVLALGASRPASLAALAFVLATTGWPGWGRLRGPTTQTTLTVAAPGWSPPDLLLTASKPVGFALPALAARTPVVGVVDLAEGTRMSDAVAARIKAAGRIDVLLLRADAGAAARVARFGRTLDLESCVPVVTARERDMAVCTTRD